MFLIIKMSKIVDNLYKKVKKDKGNQRPYYEEIAEGVVNQADVLYLPTDEKGFKYLLVVIDNGSRKIDFQPLKTHSSESIINAFEKIYKRKILKKPGIIQTDAGTEFKGDTIKWMKDNNIHLRVAQVNRHRQVALAEAMNKIIGKYIFKKQLEVELITGVEYTNWVRYLKEIRDMINEKAGKRKVRKRKSLNPIFHNNELKIGQKVRVALEGPINHLTRKPLIGRFRETDIRWDPKIRTIMNISLKPDMPMMYYLNDLKDRKKILRVGYTRNQLQPVDDDEVYPDAKKVLENEKLDEYVVQKILQHKLIGRKLMLKVKWAGYSDTTWEDVKDIKHLDIVKEYLEDKFGIKI